VGRVIQRKNYTPLRVEKKLRAMLDEPKYARRAAQVANMLAAEDGVGAACDALEELYAGTKRQ
jgi:UDP:flavonoid glycosyltransferase YjiC (YdhE family)